MTIARIIAPLTGAARDVPVLETAFAAARPFSAHVTGLFVHPDARLAVPYSGVPMSPTVVQDIVNAVENLARKAEKKALETLHAVSAAGHVDVLPAPRKSASVTSSFRTVEGNFARCVGHAAMFADLVVLGPMAPDEPDIAEAFLETLTAADRPVLIAPEVPKHLARNIVVGWNGSTAAAHAVKTALPLLGRAEKVTILTVWRDGSDPTARDLREYLALHGINAAIEDVRKDERSVEAIIDSTAVKVGADLLVIGGYSHSYWREALLGGVTQHMRWHAPCPTYIVH